MLDCKQHLAVNSLLCSNPFIITIIGISDVCIIFFLTFFTDFFPKVRFLKILTFQGQVSRGHVEAYFAFETNDWAQDEFDLSYKFDYRLKYYKEGSSFVIDRTDVVSLI